MNMEDIIAIFHQRLGDEISRFRIPPPVFDFMDGDPQSFDAEEGVLIVRFPVREEYQNPYGTMQGGMIAAAVDNTLGPLSMLVAPPNFTRRLEMKFTRPITAEIDHILVEAQFLGREGNWLNFRADVRDPFGELLARARAAHWITQLDDG